MISVRIGGDGRVHAGAASAEYVRHKRQREEEAREAEHAAQQEWDVAGRRLARLRCLERAPELLTVDVPGSEEPWAVKRGGFSDLVLCAMRSGRDAQGRLQLEGHEDVAAFVTAVLSVFVVAAPRDGRPLFPTLSAAREYVEDPSPAVADTVARLFYAAVELNPEIWPEGEEGAKKVCAALRKSGPAREGGSEIPAPPPCGTAWDCKGPAPH